jgi:hypothetical protein
VDYSCPAQISEWFFINPLRADDIINPEFRMALLQCLQFFAIRKSVVPISI